MTANRRRRELTVQGDRITDEAAIRNWLASMTPPRRHVERLSLRDPALVALTPKGRAAA